MHDSCFAWVRDVVEREGLAGCSVLEVGSQDVNGTVRPLFAGPYLGVDIAPARGVDQIADAQDLSCFPDSSFEVVISTEMLEHCPRPWVAVAEIARVASRTVILTARGYDERGCWEVHGYPHDFYRYSAGAMTVLAEDAGLRVVRCDRDPEGPGWFLLCRR